MPNPRESYDHLVASFVSQLEAGTAPWIKPWKAGTDLSLPHNAVTRRPYGGVNVLYLWAAREYCDYPTQGWLTFNQCKAAGGNVIRGQHGSQIVFMKSYNKTDADGEEHNVTLMRGFTVFNLAQCENVSLPARKVAAVELAPEDDADRFIANAGAIIQRGGDRAFYTPTADYIQLPNPEAFTSRQHEQSTALHELAHWTGHESRLARTFGQRFGDHAYAAEELVAELTSAFLCAELGIAGQLQHVEYLAHWAKSLKAEPKILWSAASKATQAREYLSERANQPQLQAA